MNISIIGLGYFGFALLKHLDSKKEKNFTLLARDRKKELIDNLQKNKKHTLFHSNTTISENIIFSENLSEIIPQSDIIILAVPSTAIKEVIKNITPYITKKVIFVNTAKALDKKSGKLLSQIIKETVPNHVEYSLAHIAGGTIASDLFKQEPLGIDIASKDNHSLHILEEIFSSPRLHVSTTNDIKGVELASAYKNIVAVLTGIVSGLGFSYGSQTHIISRSAKEIIDLVKNQGYKISEYPFSSYSQCWGNDMLMSCTGNTRNRNFGIEIGKLGSTKQAIQKMKEQNLTIESIPSIESLKENFKETNENPVLQCLYNIVIKNHNPRESILNIFSQ